MNIIVRPYGSDSCYCRPDTTWERENKDFYSPDCINELHWAPILFVRISKAGKCIGAKFASRYWDAFGFGALMYLGDFMPCIASASCADHTSLLPFPLYNPIVLENEENTYEVLKNNESIFNISAGEALKMRIEETICKASQLTSLRIGDFVAVELASLAPLASRPDGQASFKATFCENESYNFKVIF